MSPLARRSVLAGVAGAGLGTLAGCGAFGSRTARGATDVVLHNAATDDRTVAVTVTETDAEAPRVDRELDLAPNTRVTINNEVLKGSDYTVAVTMTGAFADSPYSESYDWRDAGQSLHVIVHEQIVFAVQVG